MGGAVIAVAGAQNAFHLGLILTAFGFGFRHGIDWDHIAALTDITGSQDNSGRSIFFATMYTLGHTLVVFVLGVAAIVLAERLPASLETVMERLVGVTLLMLGSYVFYTLARHGRDFRMRSRWMLVFAAVKHGAAGYVGYVGYVEIVTPRSPSSMSMSTATRTVGTPTPTSPKATANRPL